MDNRDIMVEASRRINGEDGTLNGIKTTMKYVG